MLGTTTKLSMPFQVLGLCLHFKKVAFFLGLGLTITRINITKVQKPEKSNIKMYKDAMMGHQKYTNKVGII